MISVLIVEDGLEYIETLSRFLGERFSFERVGSGPAALEALKKPYDVVFLDMRFDRTPQGELLGDLVSAADRFNGDLVRGRKFLEDHQGNFVLAAIREAGHSVGVLLSYDFDGEVRRWEHLASRFAPVEYLPDNASPQDIAERLTTLAG